jgi:hypothetical protein
MDESSNMGTLRELQYCATMGVVPCKQEWFIAEASIFMFF